MVFYNAPEDNKCLHYHGQVTMLRLHLQAPLRSAALRLHCIRASIPIEANVKVTKLDSMAPLWMQEEM